MSRLLPLLIGYLLIMIAWSVGNPPGTSPDEYAHYLRAMGAGRGDLVAREQLPPLSEEDAEQEHLRWQWRQARVVEIRATLAPELFNCDGERRQNWDCPQVEVPAQEVVTRGTWVGTYPPYVYIVPGFLMGTMTSAVDALLVGRLASMVLSFALLCLAILALYDDRAPTLSILGPLVAVTPMVTFVLASLTSSGPEIAAGASLIGGLLCLTRCREENSKGRRRLGWVAAGLGAAVLMVSRDLGPVWAALLVGVVLALSGFRKLFGEIRRGGVTAVGAIVAGACGLVAALHWRINYQVSPQIDLSRLIGDLKPSFSISPQIAKEQIGVFGHLSVALPGWVYLVWSLMAVALVLAAMLAGSFRERTVLLLAVLAGVLIPVGVHAVQLQVGFGVQGRHVMPFTVGIPILAGEILTRHTERLGRLRRLRPGMIVSWVAAALLAFSWYFNAKQYLVGPAGPDPFWAFTAAGPPVAWEIIAGVTALGALCVALAGHLTRRARP